MPLGLDWFKNLDTYEFGDSYRGDANSAREKLFAESSLLVHALQSQSEKEESAERKEEQKADDKTPRKATLQIDSGSKLEFTIAGDKVTNLIIDSKLSFTRQGGTDVWDANNNGVLSQWFGDIVYNADGSYTFRTRGDKFETTTRKDGTVIVRDDNGSAVESRAGLVVSVVRSDKKSITIQQDKGKIISLTDTEGLVWKRDGQTDRFVCEKNKEVRTALSVTKEGLYSFTDKDGNVHSIAKTGREKISFTDKSSIEKSVAGNLEQIQRSDGTKVECKYDAQRRLLQVVIAGTTTYSRTDGDSTAWTYSSGGNTEKYNGAVEVTAEGTCIYTNTDKGSKDYVQRDGKRWAEYSDRTRVDLNPDGKPSKVTRPDGLILECEYKNNELQQLTEVGVTGTKVVWNKKSGENRWLTMSYPGAVRKDVEVAANGVLTYRTVVNTKFTHRTDGTSTIEKEDGTNSEVDRYYRPLTIRMPNASEYTCKWSDKGMEKFEEKVNGLKTTWNRDAVSGVWTSPTKAGESLKNFTVENDGNMRYISFKNGIASTIRYIDGSTRIFTFDDKGEVSKVVEKSGPNGLPVTWEKKAGTDIWSNGTISEERKNVTVTDNGEYRFNRGDEKHIYYFDGSEALEKPKKPAPEKVESSGIKLWNLMQKELKDSKERTNFRQDMEAFYKRAAVNGVSDTQVAETFQKLCDIMSADEKKAVLKPAERADICKQLLHHVAFPRAIDQGFHETCNVATVQVVLAAKEPERFVDVVKQLAIDGTYHTPDGTKINIEAGSLKPDWQAKLYRPYDAGRNDYYRSHASQLFQVAAVNSYYSVFSSNLRYEQRAPEDPEDRGERVVDTTNNNVVMKVPGLTPWQIAEVTKQMTGRYLPVLLFNQFNDANCTKIDSGATLQTQMEQLQKEGKLPAIVVVNMAKEPFKTESGHGRTGNDGAAWHVVTVWNIDKQGKVLLDNQWGRRTDKEGLRRIPAETLFQAMRQ